mmetsp:Transcript_9575/g.41302  ORF Transcript_9575/g.41302 Transcript_9575/m.41302 type:complete len:298 (-) Transcript_9575:1335-2228(-)
MAFVCGVDGSRVLTDRKVLICSRVNRAKKRDVKMGGTAVPGTSEYSRNMRERLDELSCCENSAMDELWEDMQDEAILAANDEPLLASFLFATILNQKTFIGALAFHLANKLSGPSMPNTLLLQLIKEVMEDGEVKHAVRMDLLAIMERDPACTRFIDPFLYYKGFHALQGYRVAHALWNQNRRPLAYFLQAQISKELQVDIHPNAKIGAGTFIDHATGVVIGETAVLGDNVSLLHQVTLGGSGLRDGDRHPKIGDGVLIGAGATLVGDIDVGEGAQVGAGTMVYSDIPSHVTAVVSA